VEEPSEVPTVTASLDPKPPVDDETTVRLTGAASGPAGIQTVRLFLDRTE